MSARITDGGPALDRWVVEFGTRETPLMRRLREETAAMPNAQMQISPDEGQMLAFLARLIDARRTIEVGTFTGYSALAVGSVLPDDGQLIACDVSAEWTAIGSRYWREAGIEHKIDLRIAPAAETLAQLQQSEPKGSFDFAFIDADKENYDFYYEACLYLVRAGGLIAIDNMLWSGAVADPEDKRVSTEALRALTRKIHADTRVDLALATICDGVMLVQPR